MSQQANHIENIIAPSLRDMGFDLVRVQLIGGKHRPTLQILAERLDGLYIGVDDCQIISKHISALLDVEDPIQSAYTLEVSSAGIDRPLTKPEHYAAWLGFDAKLDLHEGHDRKRYKGVLIASNDTEITIRDDQGEHTVPYSIIRAARLLLTDALIAESGRRAAALKPVITEQTGE